MIFFFNYLLFYSIHWKSIFREVFIFAFQFTVGLGATLNLPIAISFRKVQKWYVDSVFVFSH